MEPLYSVTPVDKPPEQVLRNPDLGAGELTEVQIPAPTHCSQLSIIPVPGGSDSLFWPLQGTRSTHDAMTCVQTKHIWDININTDVVQLISKMKTKLKL